LTQAAEAHRRSRDTDSKARDCEELQTDVMVEKLVAEQQHFIRFWPDNLQLEDRIQKQGDKLNAARFQVEEVAMRTKLNDSCLPKQSSSMSDTEPDSTVNTAQLVGTNDSCLPMVFNQAPAAQTPTNDPLAPRASNDDTDRATNGAESSLEINPSAAEQEQAKVFSCFEIITFTICRAPNLLTTQWAMLSPPLPLCLLASVLLKCHHRWRWLHTRPKVCMIVCCQRKNEVPSAHFDPPPKQVNEINPSTADQEHAEVPPH